MNYFDTLSDSYAVDNSQDFSIPTRFDFCPNLVGGEKYIILGTTGTGKTTLVNSIVSDVSKNNKVLVYSTEEHKKKFYDNIKNLISSEQIKNIKHLHEEKLRSVCKVEDFNSFFKYLSKEILNSKAKVLVFDNITTSLNYESVGYNKKIDFFIRLSDMVASINIPLLLVAHTDARTKDLQDSLYTANDINGPKITAKKCENIFGYQRLIINIPNNEYNEDTLKKGGIILRSFVRVLKSRSSGSSQKIYKLDYDHAKNTFSNDIEIDFDKFNEYYKQIVRLSRK